jgi:aspartate racemase
MEYLGRSDHQVKIRGFRIELGEIEATLARHPAVRQNVVIVREDHPGERQLVAYVVLREHLATTPTAQELRRFAGDHLPVHMTPMAVVILSTFPLTPSGKIHRLALPAPTWTRAAEDSADTSVPLNAVERKLVSVWEEALGVSPIGSHDNFFDMGGHSLLAVRIFAQLETIFGVNLPLAVLFSAPTVEQLAEVIARKQPSHASDALVAIQQGGEKRPLFLIHPLGGGVLGFAPLARHLGPDQPVYGLQPDIEDPGTDIVEMATHYIGAMRTVQPTGPYNLVGYSAGGLIALEMAQQLKRQGEQISLLGMLDTHATNPQQQISDLLNARFAVRLLRDMPGYLSEYLTQRTMRSRMESLRVLSRVMANRLARLLSRRHDGKSQRMRAMLFDAWMEKRASQLPPRLGNVVQAHSMAVRNYAPQAYSGRVTIFRATSQVLFSSHFLDLGWGRLTKSVTIYRVPGAHGSLVAEPHVRVLAERLRACLLETQAADASGADAERSTHVVLLEAEGATQ